MKELSPFFHMDLNHIFSSLVCVSSSLEDRMSENTDIYIYTHMPKIVFIFLFLIINNILINCILPI